MLLPEVELSGFPLKMRYFKKKSSILAGKEGHFREAISPLTTHPEKSILGPSDSTRLN